MTIGFILGSCTSFGGGGGRGTLGRGGRGRLGDFFVLFGLIAVFLEDGDGEECAMGDGGRRGLRIG